MSGVKKRKTNNQASVITLPMQEDERHVIDKMADIDHLIYSGDIYLGQTVHTKSPAVSRFLLDLNKQQMKYEEDIIYPAGLAKIFDEGLVNAADNARRGGGTKDIKVHIEQQTSTISITNDGKVFDIVKMPYKSRANPNEQAYQPELAFFHPRTSSAYRKKNRTTGGKFGLGAKLMFIFSTWGKVTMCDGKLIFEQEVRDHMKVVLPPKVKEAPKRYQGKPFLTVSFKPDLVLFYPKGEAPENFSQLIMRVFMTRIFDVAGTTEKKVKVSYKLDDDKNWQRTPICTFKDYVKLFLPEKDRKDLEEAKGNLIGYYECERWQVAVFRNPYDFPISVSFVNNINTYNGGEHVKYIMSQVVDFCRGIVDPKLDTRRVYQNVMICVNSVIVDASFPSQCKESLTTTADMFGSTCKLDSRCLNTMKRNGVIEALKSSLEDKEMDKVRREIGAGRKKPVHDIPHLRDAKHAGGRQRNKCTLYFVEGVSALELATVGLTLLGADYNGAMALKGKIINPDGKSLKKLLKNKEFVNICRTLGLEVGKSTPRSELRYNRIVLMMDRDLDGSHIMALFIHLFSTFWPHLLQEKDFITLMLTPIVVAHHKNKKKEVHRFYTQQNYDIWWKNVSENQQKKYTIKYYKGLATSTAKEGKYYFRNPTQHMKPFRLAQEADKKVIENVMGKGKGKSDWRKDWIQGYDETIYIPFDHIRNLSYEEFFNREVIHYSWYSIVRGIPLCEDGFTPAARKCVYTMLKKNITSEMKVDAIQTRVSLTTNYHHGANSLGETTVRLAQTITGKQNMNLFFPKGQFGCLAPDTPVLMWDATIKRADEVKQGDLLVGDDGTSRSVMSIVEGEDDMYEIERSVLPSYFVNSEHILTVYVPSHKSIFWKSSDKSWIMYYFDSIQKRIRIKSFKATNTRTREEAKQLVDQFAETVPHGPIFDISIKEYMKIPKSYKEMILGVSNFTPTQWTKQEVPMDPYILGLWLGGGMSDEDHAFKDKHIPKNYIFNDEETRLYLLAGLIDAGGCLSENLTFFEFTQAHDLKKLIVDDVALIARSLGFTCSVSTNNHQMKVVTISGDIWKIPTRVTKNQVQTKESVREISTHSFTVVPAGKGKFNGWQVDKNERFLLGDFTITHNSRIDMGQTHGATRYISTYLEKVTPLIFPTADLNVLPPMLDEGKETEPFKLSPIIPMILVNGAQNIGTGYRSSIACYKPEELITKIKQKIKGETVDETFHPWYHKFKGTVKNHSTKKGKFTTYGIIEHLYDKTYAITELPVKVSTINYKEKLIEMVNKNILKCFNEKHTIEDIYFEVQFNDQFEIPEDLITFFGLHDTFTPIRNLLIESGDQTMSISSFKSVMDIFNHWFDSRFKVYTLRRNYFIQMYQAKIPYLAERTKFINAVLDKTIILGSPKKEIYAKMETLNISEEYHSKLWSITIGKMVKETILEMEKERVEAQNLLDYYLNSTEADLWLKDLQQLEQALPDYWESRYALEDDSEDDEDETMQCSKL